MMKRTNVALLFSITLITTSAISGDVLLLHTGRCGSTLLLDSLRKVIPSDLVSIPKLADSSATEIGKRLAMFPGSTSSLHVASTEELLWHASRIKRLLSDSHREHKSRFVIESVKFVQISDVGLGISQFFDICRAAGFRHLIVLHRNYLRSAVSFRLVEEASGQWHLWRSNAGNGSTNCDGRKVEIPESAIDVFHATHSMYREALLSDSFSSSSLLLSYENMIYANVSVAVGAVLSFLGIRPMSAIPPPALSKTGERWGSPLPLSLRC